MEQDLRPTTTTQSVKHSALARKQDAVAPAALAGALALGFLLYRRRRGD
jgi:hypothetical protein